MESIAWKVVVIKDKKMMSTNTVHYAAGKTAQLHCLEYNLNEKQVPKVGKIFTFKTRSAARNWKKKTSGNEYKYTILKGTAQNLKKLKKESVLSVSYFENIEKYWATIDTCLKIYGERWETPNDTYICDSFTPTEKVS